jgi:hypothetical protein
METLIRLYGPLHEFLHVLALWLIGRRAVTWTNRYVDLPPDLTTGQYLFVAGLPALVFWGVAGGGLLLLLGALDLGRLALGLGLLLVGGLGGFGTLGDLQRIWARVRGEEC